MARRTARPVKRPSAFLGHERIGSSGVRQSVTPRTIVLYEKDSLGNKAILWRLANERNGVAAVDLLRVEHRGNRTR